MAKSFDKQLMIETLKGAQKIDMAEFLIKEVAFFNDMKRKFGGKEALVVKTETRLRDLMWVFANAANTAFPEQRQIGEGSLGLLTEPLDNYTFTLLIEKKEAAE